MRRDEAFLAHHVLLAAGGGILLVYSVLACGIVLLCANNPFATWASGIEILACVMLFVQSMRPQRIWQMRIGGVNLVLMGLYWSIGAALTRAALLYGYRSWIEGAGGILVLLGIAVLWSGDGSWFAPLEEVEHMLPLPRPLRKFGGKI